MNTTNQFPVLNMLTTLLISVSASIAFADRSVSVTAPDGKLQLTNPTGGTVTYTVECYDKISGANIITGYSSTTLAAKRAVTIQSSGTCAGGTTPAKTLSQGPFFCAGSVDYASAASLCGTDSHVCTIANVAASGANASDFLGYYWIKPHSSATTWYNTWDNWSKSNNPQDTAGKKAYAPVSYTKSPSSNRCSEGSGGTGASMQGCGSYNTSTTTGTMCCPDNNGFASCKVTIHGNGVAAGHLQSPQFKGGASF